MARCHRHVAPLPSRWEGLTVTVTKPDNTTEILGPFRTDSTGSTGAVHVPTMVGKYYFQTHFPEQVYNWPTASDWAPGLVGDVLYQASSSRQVELTVQAEPIPYYESRPLPTEYWHDPSMHKTESGKPSQETGYGAPR